jgi:hypothetical protein
VIGEITTSIKAQLTKARLRIKASAPLLRAVVVVGPFLLVLLAVFLTALRHSKSGELAGALGSVVGGMFGASGAAVAVYLTLAAQRQEDRTRISAALAREITEFARLVVGHLETCENIRAGGISLPAATLAEAMEMPQPIIYPAVADKIGLLQRPQRAVAFYARIIEMAMMVRTISRGPLAKTAILQGADIRHVVEAWVDIAHFAELIIADSEPADDFDQAVKDSILRDLRDQIAIARDKFQIKAEQPA